eukprot:2179795-Pleurochrysis_carterae.AAC.2
MALAVVRAARSRLRCRDEPTRAGRATGRASRTCTQAVAQGYWARVRVQMMRACACVRVRACARTLVRVRARAR